MSLPHKILYIGSLDRESNSHKRYITLKQMGYDIEGIDVDKYIFGTIWTRFHFHLYFGPGIIKLNKKILEVVDTFKPDLIWVDNKPYIKENTLIKIRNNYPEIKIINLITDDPFGKYHYAWRFIYKTFKYYDVHFVQREINIPELKKKGANRVETCFRSFDPFFHIKMSKEDPELFPFSTKIGFIGSYEDDRADYIAYLVQNGISLTITGDGWEKGKHWNLLKPFYKSKAVYGNDYVKSINGMDIALHFLRKANRDQQDSRTFEIPACGTFMLAERSHLHSSFFEEGKEADYFTSKQELLEKVRYYLNQNDMRFKIAEAGFERSYTSGYDHKSRLIDVLDKIYHTEPIQVKKHKTILVGIYYDPEFYPPTINAILNLAELCEELIVVCRNQALLDYPYPGNVRIVKTGKFMSVIESESKSIGMKLYSFLIFTVKLFLKAKKKSTDLVVLYDSIPLFSYYLIKYGINDKKSVWYHNHDMPAIHPVRKYSVSWFAAKYEKKAMESIRFFSLPSLDRLSYYPNWNRSDDFFLIPNYPSLKLKRSSFNSSLSLIDEIRIIYQGTIGDGHALEQLIEILDQKIDSHHLKLVLKGSVREKFKKKLEELAKLNGVSDRIEWVPLGPYHELNKITSGCQIGIAIYLNSDIVRKTMGTASNKIYEYAAAALPIIVFDNPQFRKYLDKYEWVFFYDGSVVSLKKCIENIIQDHSNLSRKAKQAYENGLNFETVFKPVLEKLKNNL